MSTASMGITMAQAAAAVSEAMAKFAESMRQIGTSLGRYAEGARQWSLAHEQRVRGGNGSDAIRFPDQWQSAVCSAWLHQSCPSDTHQLACTCTCHQKGKL